MTLRRFVIASSDWGECVLSIAVRKSPRWGKRGLHCDGYGTGASRPVEAAISAFKLITVNIKVSLNVSNPPAVNILPPA